MFYAGLELGVIGPFGFGKEMQSFLHHITNSVKPKGWKNQIKNTLLVNYSLGIEKSLLDFNSLFNLNGHFNGTLGTGNMHINTGITFQLGRINDLFSNEINNWSLYFFYKPNLKIIGYDASLQGSLFQDNSTYKLSDIAFLVFSQTFGISVISKKVYIEFSYSGMSKEFKTGDCHQWGALKLGYIL